MNLTPLNQLTIFNVIKKSFSYGEWRPFPLFQSFIYFYFCKRTFTYLFLCLSLLTLSDNLYLWRVPSYNPPIHPSALSSLPFCIKVSLMLGWHSSHCKWSKGYWSAPTPFHPPQAAALPLCFMLSLFLAQHKASDAKCFCLEAMADLPSAVMSYHYSKLSLWTTSPSGSRQYATSIHHYHHFLFFCKISVNL